MQLEEAIDEYLAHLRIERGASLLTIEAYAADLADYASFIEEASIVDVSRIDRDAIFAYEADLVEREYAITSIDRHVSVVKSFHKFCQREEFTADNPASDVHMPQKPAKLPDVLSIEEANALLEQFVGDDPRTLRDRAILEVLYGCGLRVSE